jgi:hypothetical protein
LLNVISPLGLQASLEAFEGLNQREHEQRQTLEYKLVQLQYEAQRAFEQRSSVAERYNSCRQYRYNVVAHISLEQPDETPDTVPAR